MKFNINGHVMVRLNDFGREILRKDREDLIKFLPESARGEYEKLSLLEEDADGWSKWQLWSLMEVFGGHMSLGMEVPFETEIIILE